MENLVLCVKKYTDKRRLEKIEQETKKIFEEATAKIAEKYIGISNDWIKTNEPALNQEIDIIEERLDIVWRNCLDGKDSIENFKSVVNEFYNIYSLAIDRYNSQQNLISKNV